MEYIEETSLLTDDRTTEISIEPGSMLYEILNKRVPTCIHEMTKDRIFITKNMGKQFGLRIFNALFIPFKFKLHNVRFGAPQEYKHFLICVFNHIPGDLENLKHGI